MSLNVKPREEVIMMLGTVMPGLADARLNPDHNTTQHHNPEDHNFKQ
jgi:hypothetical protein